jgi:hypothetical protein
MATTVRSLWSDQIRPNILSPWTILKSQADALTKQTNGVLVGQLSERGGDNNACLLALDITVPGLGDYRQRVLVATYDRDRFYPVTLDAEIFRPAGVQHFIQAIGGLPALSEGKAKPANRADTDTELTNLVEKVLTSAEVVSLAQSLIARVHEVAEETEHQSRANPYALAPGAIPKEE